MNLDRAGAIALATDVARHAAGKRDVDVAAFPAFVHLDAVQTALAAENLVLTVGAQDAWHEPDGAFTGEVSLAMLADLDIRWLLTGHSERRHVIGESDELVGAKTAAGLAAGCTVVLCVGETIEQREAGETDAVNARQLDAGLKDVSPDQTDRLIIAYEPVWAIGTGKTASPADAQAAHAAVRAWLAQRFDDRTAQTIRILYGGSVKPGNAGELFGQEDVDGGLVGGASLKAGDFAGILDAAGG
jgi:triosephosphate isomerase